MKKILVAATAAVALATPAMAFDVQWSGDFNNRFMYSNQADVAKNFFGEGYANNYISGILNSDQAGSTTTVSGVSIPNAGAGTIFGAIDIPTGTLISSRLPNFAKKKYDSDFFGEVKYRMQLKATDDDKKVNGVIGFEFGGAKYGDNSKLDFAGDKNIFELRHAYVDFEVPFDPATRLSVGLQPVGYNKFLWSDNAAGVKWTSKRGALGYSLGWFRDDVDNNGNGGSTKLNNDDAYAIDVTYAIEGGPKLNAFVLYLEEGNENLKFDTDPGTAGVQAIEFMDQQLWYGLAAEGQAANFFYGGTFIYEDGELKFDDENLDRKAWLLNLEGTVKLDKARVKLGYLYSTGDDDPLDDKAENFSNIDAYMGGFGSVVVFDSYADDNTLATAPYILDKGLNMVYLGADVDLNDKASVGASYLWINTAEDFDLGGLVTSADKEIGNEVSVRASYKVTKNLTAGIEAGYLFVGDGLDNYNKAAFGESADDIFRSDASIRLKF